MQIKTNIKLIFFFLLIMTVSCINVLYAATCKPPSSGAGSNPTGVMTGTGPQSAGSNVNITDDTTKPAGASPASAGYPPSGSTTTATTDTTPPAKKPPAKPDTTSTASGGGYNPLSDPAFTSGGGQKPPVDTTQIGQLGQEFQSGLPGGQNPTNQQGGQQGQQQPIQQPPTYTDGGTKPDDTSGTATGQQPYPPGAYPPYEQPPYPPAGDSPQGTDWGQWATKPPRPQAEQPQKPQQPSQPSQPPGDKPPQPPPDTRTVACSATTKSGADAPATVTVKVGKSPGIANFSYNMYTVKDRMIVRYDGKTLDTGCVSGSKTIPLSLSGVSDEVTVIVQPACEKKGTQWVFKLECPK